MTLPPTLTKIGASAFRSLNSLAEITLPPVLTSIGRVGGWVGQVRWLVGWLGWWVGGCWPSRGCTS